MCSTIHIFDQKTAVSVINFISTASTQTFGIPCKKAKYNIENKHTLKSPKKKSQIQSQISMNWNKKYDKQFVYALHRKYHVFGENVSRSTNHQPVITTCHEKCDKIFVYCALHWKYYVFCKQEVDYQQFWKCVTRSHSTIL